MLLQIVEMEFASALRHLHLARDLLPEHTVMLVQIVATESANAAQPLQHAPDSQLERTVILLTTFANALQP